MLMFLWRDQQRTVKKVLFSIFMVLKHHFLFSFSVETTTEEMLQ